MKVDRMNRMDTMEGHAPAAAVLPRASCFLGSGAPAGFLEKNQEDDTILRGAEGVLEVGRHVDPVAGAGLVCLRAKSPLAAAGKLVKQGADGGGMLGEFLPLGEGEADDLRVLVLKEALRDDAAGLQGAGFIGGIDVEVLDVGL